MQGQGATAADRHPQPAAHQLLAHLGPEQPAGQGVQRPAQGSAADRQQPPPGRFGRQGEVEGLALGGGETAAVGQRSPQQPLARGRHLRQGRLEARQQRLPQPRHADQVVGPHPLQVVAQLLESCVGLPAAAGEQEILSAALVGVPDRQHTHHPVAGPGRHRHPQVAELVEQVGVAQRHPLGLAGGAGGVEDRGQPLGIGRGCGRGPARRQGLLAAAAQLDPAQAWRQSRQRGHLPLQHHHEAQRGGQLAGELQPLQQRRRLHHQPHGAGVLQDVAQLLQGGGAAPHRVGGAGPHQPLVAEQPAGAVLGEQGHHVAFARPQAGEGRSQLLDAPLQFAVAEALRLGGVGGLQGRSVAVLAGQLRPELLQPRERTPVVALGQGLAVAVAGGPVDRGEGHRRGQIAGGLRPRVTTPAGPRGAGGGAAAAGTGRRRPPAAAGAAGRP